MEEKKITIFIDRDGIINRGSEYHITKWSQFVFMPHIFNVLRVFKERNYRVIIVTNQSGVAKGLMTMEDVIDIHNRMKQRICMNGGHIDRVYFCPHDSEGNCSCKKPKSGMFLEAKRDFPSIDFSDSFIIGDWWSDMDAASALGIKTCYLVNQLTNLHKCRVEPDFCISDISQAIQLVPTYFENKEIHEFQINWIGGENDKSYGKHIRKDGCVEPFGRI